VVGAGQEQDDQGNWTVNKENSLVVQPAGKMAEDDFENHNRELLFDPTDEQGKGHQGPFPHSQWGALMKLPSDPEFYTLFHVGQTPTGPWDYVLTKREGDTAVPRLGQERYCTQMKYGPRADPAMMDPLDQPGDVGNPRPGTGKPGAGLPGKRFTIANRSVP
jgi:hypothetical protein